MNCTAIRAEDGRHITLPQPIGLELKCTCSSPARQATLTFETEEPLPPLAELQIEGAGRRTPLFTGTIDEQIFARGQSDVDVDEFYREVVVAEIGEQRTDGSTW